MTRPCQSADRPRPSAAPRWPIALGVGVARIFTSFCDDDDVACRFRRLKRARSECCDARTENSETVKRHGCISISCLSSSPRLIECAFFLALLSRITDTTDSVFSTDTNRETDSDIAFFSVCADSCVFHRFPPTFPRKGENCFFCG